MSESPVCDSFVLHKWKKELCANCQKPKSKHTAPGKSERAKQSSSITTKKPSSSKSPETPAAKSKPLRQGSITDGKKVESDKNKDEKEQKLTGAKTKGNISDCKKAESDKTKEEKDQKTVGVKTKNLKQSTSKEVLKPPAKPKPTVASKPGHLSPQAKDSPAVKKAKAVSGSAKEESASTKVQTKPTKLHSSNSKEELAATKGEIKPGKGKKVEKHKGNVDAKIKGKTKSPTHAPATEVYDSPPPTSQEKVVCPPGASQSKAVPARKQEQHYYHKYDVTAKGKSGSPQPLKNHTEDNSDAQAVLTPAYRVVDIASKPVALPYTVVDVSSTPPSIDPSTLDSPPKLPDCIPERDDSNSQAYTGKSSTAPVLVPRKSSSPSTSASSSPATKPKGKGSASPATKHKEINKPDSPSCFQNMVSGSMTTPSPDRSRKVKLFDSDKVSEEEKTHSLPRMPVILYDEAAQMQLDARSPTPPRKVPILIPRNGEGADAYELIEGANIKDDGDRKSTDTNTVQSIQDQDSGPPVVPKRTTSRQHSADDEKFSRQSPGRGSGGKSAAFEAKMAALAQNLDLQKSKSKPEAVPEQVDETANAESEPQPPLPVVILKTPPSKKKFSTQTDTNKPEKGKKGKGFFSKLFRRRGSSNSSKESIEIVHIDTLDGEKQLCEADNVSQAESQLLAEEQTILEGDPADKISGEEEIAQQGSAESPHCKKATRTDSFKDTALTNELTEKLQSKLMKCSLREANLQPLSVTVPTDGNINSESSPVMCSSIPTPPPDDKTVHVSPSSTPKRFSPGIKPKPTSPGIKPKPPSNFASSKTKSASPGNKSVLTYPSSHAPEKPGEEMQSSIISGESEVVGISTVAEQLQTLTGGKQDKPISPKPGISHPKPLSPKPDVTRSKPVSPRPLKSDLSGVEWSIGESKICTSQTGNANTSESATTDQDKSDPQPIIPPREGRRVTRRTSGDGKDKPRKPGQAPPAPPPGPPPAPPGKPPAPLPQTPPPPPSQPPPYSPPGTSPVQSLTSSPSHSAKSQPVSPLPVEKKMVCSDPASQSKQSLSPTASPVHKHSEQKEEEKELCPSPTKESYSSLNKEIKSTKLSNLSIIVPSTDSPAKSPTKSPETISPRELGYTSSIDDQNCTERRKSKIDGKTVKSVRRMSAAPPPPPVHAACGKRLSTGDINLTTEASGRALTTSPPAPIIATTLPFPAAKSTNPKFKLGQSSSTDEIVPSRREKKTRQPRSKTLSEGIKVDIEVLHSSFRRQHSFPTTGSDLRSSKFLQRALPSPPPLVKEEEASTPVAEEAEDREMENIYEMVSQDKNPASVGQSKHRTSPYEDIDNDIYDDIEKPRRRRPPLQPPDASDQLGPSSYYLEPVSHSSPHMGKQSRHCRDPNNTDLQSGIGTQDTKPKPGPRQKTGSLHSSSAGTEPYVMMYANREMILDRPAVSMLEGFRKMTAVNLSSLQTISESILAGIIPAGLNCEDSPKWEDFAVADNSPMYSHSGVAYYGAKSSMHNLDSCVLMISVFPVAWDVSEYSHMNVVSPTAVFHDKVASDFFPDVSGLPDPHEYQLCGLVDTTILLLNYQTVCNLEGHVASLRTLWADEMDKFERQVCYILMQILNGLLYLTDKGCPVNSLHMQDILVVTPCGRDEELVVLNPHGHHTVGQNSLMKDLQKQMSKLLCSCLSVEIPPDDKSLYKVLFPVRSTYTKGLQKCHKAIHSDDHNAFIIARNILEYMLWGPAEEEIKPLSLAEDRDQAFAVWLELQRCKVVSQHALKELQCNIETACRMNFLCAATGSTLFDTTKLLYM